MAKSKHIMVSKKTKRKKKVGGKSSTKGGSAVPVGTIFLGGSREANEAKWDEISSTLSRILQGEVIVVQMPPPFKNGSRAKIYRW